MHQGTPPTRTGDFVETLHGVSLKDPYRWLEQASPERTMWIEAQNRHAHTTLQQIESRPRIQKRLEELLLVDTVGGPSVTKGGIFFYKFDHTQQHAVLYRRDWPEGEEQVVLDPNTLSEDGSISLAETSITEDGKLLAYGLSLHGSDWFRWQVMNVRTKQILDEIPRLAYSQIAWLPDNSGFFYTRSEQQDPEKLTKNFQRVFFHKMGTDWRNDHLIFGEGLPEHRAPYVGEISEDGKHALLGIYTGYVENELWYWDLTERGEIHPLTEGAAGSLFSPKIKDDMLYVLTNHQAPKYQLCRASLEKVPTLDLWETLVPEDKDAIVDSFSVFEKRIFVGKKVNVTSRIYEHNLEGKCFGEIALPTLGSASVPDGREEMNAVFLTFTSFTHPTTTYRYDLTTRQLTEFTKNNYPFHPEDFTTEQVWFRSKDNTQVPMFVVRKKGTVLDGRNPTILTGYGGFNVGEAPSFSASRIVWLEQGGILAVANLRGGNEFGEQWHTQGMLGNKQNVFDDFISAGEALVGKKLSSLEKEGEYSSRRYTSPGHLGIEGGSNGGLLVGAALVQRPDLWAAVNCDVPLLDMLRFHLTEGGRYWKTEYGDPENPEHFSFLLAYSPYHNVKPERYPAVLFETSLGDDRGVDPMHAMKMAARLQANNFSENHILLLVKEKTGHGHGKPMKMVIEELVDSYAFMERYLRKG